MLQPTLKPRDLHVLCLNQQRNAYAEVVLASAGILEDAIREAWRYFFSEGPPDDVADVHDKLAKNLGSRGDSILDPLGLEKMFFVLKRKGFFKAWSRWRNQDSEIFSDEKLHGLLKFGNEFRHRRSATQDGSEELGLVTRKESRDMAKAGLRALDALGQLRPGQMEAWGQKLGDRPVDPPVNNLPSAWYRRLFGREEDITRLIEAWQLGNFTRFALEGPAGIGKSSIVREFCNIAFGEGLVHQVVWVSGKERYYTPEGVLIERGPIDDKFAHVMEAILAAFDVEVDNHDPSVTARELLATCEQPILVMDNWESLQDERALEDWIDELPGNIRILYTSRRGVTQARPIRVEGLSRAAATSLLSDQMKDTDVWTPVMNSPEQLRVIANETDGNPLLLMMLASIVIRQGTGFAKDIRTQLFSRRRGRDLLEFMHDYNLDILGDAARRAFTVAPLLAQPVRADHLAAALSVDQTSGWRLLSELEEAGLATRVANKGALSPFIRERFKIHPFSLQFAQRLLASQDELARDVSERIDAFINEASELTATLRSKGHAPIGDQANLVDDVVLQDVARLVRGANSRMDVEQLISYGDHMPPEIAQSSWFAGVCLDSENLIGTQEKYRLAKLAKALSAPTSRFVLDWVTRRAIEEGDMDKLESLVINHGAVDLIELHKLAFQIGQQGSLEDSLLLMQAGREACNRRSGAVATRQKAYFAMGVAETLLRMSSKGHLNRSERCDLLAKSQASLRDAAGQPNVDSEKVQSLEMRITDRKRQAGCS